MKICDCERPSPHPNPRYEGKCLHGHQMDPRWLSTPETVGRFFDRLERGIFPGKPDHYWQDFRSACERREREGHDLYGLDYFDRDLLRDAAEELMDSCIYRHLRLLRRYREAGDEEALALILEASRHAFISYRLDREAEQKFLGSP